MEIINEVTLIAPNEVTCNSCGRSIEIGEKYFFQLNKADGKRWAIRTCPNCQTVINEYTDELIDLNEEGGVITEDSFAEGVEQLCLERGLVKRGEDDYDDFCTEDYVRLLVEELNGKS